MTRPSRVVFSEHAVAQITRRGMTIERVADVVLGNHPRRVRNPSSADWIVRSSGIVAAYNWPDEGDETTAYVVTAWPG